MSTTITFNSSSYTVPAEADSNWANNVSNYLIAIASGTLQKSGGTFTLTSEVDFGATYGLKSSYLKSRAANPSATGQVRLGNTESVAWRNAGNSADLSLKVNALNVLEFDGTSISVGGTPVQSAITVSDSSTIDLTLLADDISGSVIAGSLDNSHIAALAAIDYSKLNLASSIVNADVNASAAIAYSKLNLLSSILNADISAGAAIALSKLAPTTVSRALVSDASGIITPATTTATELGYVNGVTSAIQTQINTKAPLASPTFTGTVSGIDKAMVGLANVDNTSDATKNTAVATLTNKTLTTPVIDIIALTDQGSTPASPSAGTHKAYVKTATGKLTILDSSGVETAVGGGSSSGINYLSSNPDAEINTSGWSTYADAAGALPVDGTGGSPSSTFTRSTSSPLRGTASFLWTKSAANRQGEGFSYDFTIDSTDQAKILQVSFDYKIASGTYASSDLTVYLYDVTNAVIIQPAGYTIQNALVSMNQKATFQTASNSTSYRLIVHTASVSALAYTVQFDNFSVGPQVVTNGAAITDPVAYTPVFTGFGTVTNINVKSYRSGANLIVYGYFTSGTTTAVEAQMTLGYNGVSGNITSSSALPTLSLAGEALVSFTGASTSVLLMEASKTYLTFGLQDATRAALNKQQAGSVLGSSNSMTFQVQVPIQGWSSNVQLSSDTDTRVVATRAFLSADQTGVNPNNSLVKINIDSTSSAGLGYDKQAAWGSNKYTVQVPGIYDIDATLSLLGPNVLANSYALVIYKNGAAAIWGKYTTLTASTYSGLDVEGSLDLIAGDYIELYLYGAGNNSTSTLTANGTTNGSATYISIARKSGPSIIAASESVAAKYQRITAQSISNNTTTIVDFATKVDDSHGSVTTGASWKFTSIISGRFEVAAALLFDAAAGAAGDYRTLDVYKNGVQDSNLDWRTLESTTTQYGKLNGSTYVQMIAGDYIDIRVKQVNGAASAKSTNASGAYNYVTIRRVGN